MNESKKNIENWIEPILGKKEGVYRKPSKGIQTVKPEDSVILSRLTTLEFTNLAEHLDMVLTGIAVPKVVSVLAGEKGLRVVANAFDGCFDTLELCDYLKVRLGSIAARFTTLAGLGKVKMLKVKVHCQLSRQNWIEKEIELPEIIQDYPAHAGTKFTHGDRKIICLCDISNVDPFACAMVAVAHGALAFKIEFI